jgi:hypothetical protein
MRASWAFGLPCPWAPLQSVTTAASRRIRARVARRASLRGKATFFALCECCVSGLGSRARGPVCRGFVVGRASPVGVDAGVLEAGASAVCRCSAEAGDRHCTQPRVAVCPRTGSRRASPDPGPRHGDGCSFEVTGATEVAHAATKVPVGGSRPKQCASARAPRDWGGERCHRGGTFHVLGPEGCLLPPGHRGGTGAQDTQREFDDVSHGVCFLSAYEPRRSLCRFASPTPSALRVSHSLSGLSPPGPGGFVSRHIRP